MRASRARMHVSQMTAAGTYRMASRRSQRSKKAAAFGPSFPRVEAWKIKGCVSVTAAVGSATTLRRAPRHPVFRRRLFHAKWPSYRFIEQRADVCIGVRQHRIGWVDIDRAHDRSRRADGPCLTRVRYELIEELADTPEPCGSGPALQPHDVVGVQRDGDGLLRHTMFIRYSLNVVCVNHELVRA